MASDPAHTACLTLNPGGQLSDVSMVKDLLGTSMKNANSSDAFSALGQVTLQKMLNSTDDHGDITDAGFADNI
eukprot:SAG31_NODE_14374_length_810_cov_1.759494_1_plen_72_part_01